jgi:DNA-binding NarL/FixJ family response regulator
VESGRPYLSPKIGDIIFKDVVRKIPRKQLTTLPDLTAQDSEVLQLLADGGTTRDIAALLHVSIKAAEALRQEIILNHIVPLLSREQGKARNKSKKNEQASLLTSREKEILRWTREGMNTREISSLLEITTDTVKFHMKNIYKKLHATSRSQALVSALENKLLDV